MFYKIARGSLIGIFLGVVIGVMGSYLMHYMRLAGRSDGGGGYASEVSFVENVDSATMDETVAAFNEYETPHCDSLEDEILRFHVRANSNSDEDLALKYKVRDDVLTAMGGRLTGYQSIDEALETLGDNLDFVKSVAQTSIKEAGYDYDVKVYIAQDYFPIRQYGELVLPAGYYKALRIDIGEARGENFWCILYPMMCYPLEAGAVVSKEDEERLSECLGEEDYQRLFIEHDDTEVRVRFKFIEWLGL